MKLLLAALIGMSTALTGCVVVDEPHRDNGVRHDRDHDGVPNRVDRDRDGDGVRNRDDRRPDDRRRY